MPVLSSFLGANCITCKQFRTILIADMQLSENKTVRNLKRAKYFQFSIKFLRCSKALSFLRERD